MIGNLVQDHEFSIIVTEEDLRLLSNMVTNDFADVRYEINTKDGANYVVTSLEDVLNYSNIESRKIKRICIEGNKEKDQLFVCPNISIALLDTSVYKESVVLSLSKMEEKDIVFYTQKIDEFAKRIKAPYWILHKDSFYWITGISLYVIIGFIYQLCTKHTEVAGRIYDLLILQGVSGACMLFSMFILQRIVSYFFPETIFAIGEQEKYKQKKEKVRYIIFWVIFVTLVLGILSSIIANYIIKLVA